MNELVSELLKQFKNVLYMEWANPGLTAQVPPA